jgi:hypothetical protein
MPSFNRSITASLFVLCFASSLHAQRVMIKGASPSDVVVAVQKRLAPQNFQLTDSSKKEALFTLDRGMKSQNTPTGSMQVHVFLEFHLRFKPKNDSLQVDAHEEVFGQSGVHGVEFRKPVETPAEVESIQHLLNDVKTELEARPTP